MTRTSRIRCFPAGSSVFLISLICLSVATVANANDDDGVVKRDVYDLPTPVAIQGRTNNIDQSISLNAGYIPTDSFNRGFPISLAYSFYFKPYLAWEVISASYNINQETSLKRDVQELGVTVQKVGFGGVTDYPRSILMTGLVYSPLYGKSLLFNKSLIHSETSFYLGLGALMFNRSGQVPAVAPGIQARYFLSPRSAFRVYLRQYVFKDTHMGVTGITEIGAGYELQFNLFSKRLPDEDDE